MSMLSPALYADDPTIMDLLDVELMWLQLSTPFAKD
jgi:hypothetical protein